MTGRPENEFPTIADARAMLDYLIKDGFGELPIQLIVAPDSTLQALCRHFGPEGIDLPALMIKMTPDEGSDRIPVCIISVARLAGTAADTAVQ